MIKSLGVLSALAVGGAVSIHLFLHSQDARAKIHTHEACGKSVRIDLEKVRKEHARARESFKPTAAQVFDFKPTLQSDLQLPRCKTSMRTSVKLDPEVPRELVGTNIHFVSLREIAARTFTRNSAAVIVDVTDLSQAWTTLGTASLPDLGIHFATAEIARRLGVECHPATVNIKSRTDADVQMGGR